MPEFRVDGVTLSGKTVSGSITADTKGIAKSKAAELSRDKKFKVTGIHERVSFIYRVKKGNDKPIDGEQKAYTSDEVRIALEKMGFHVLYVRKKLFGNKQKAAPVIDVVSFVRVSTDLMKQKLPFNEVMQLLINDIPNPALRDAVKEINTELKQGKDSEKVFNKQAPVIGKFTAQMLGLASKSGNMAEIYESAAKFMERNMEFHKNLKSAIVSPLITLFVLFLCCLFYVMYIFPKTAEMFVKFHIKLPPMTAATLKASNWLMANVIYLAILFIVPSIFIVRFARTEKGKFLSDKYLIRIPVLGSMFHKTAIEIFCRVFYALYSGSGENIEIIRMAAEACGNKYMEHQIKTIAIPMMLERGKGLTEAFEATGVFTKTAISRFASGAETGTVKTTALQLAEYYEKETGYRMKNTIQVIELSISMIIMIVMTALTLVSSETALVKPESPHMLMPLHFLIP
jgi:type IV pilus assembly protein PilC